MLTRQNVLAATLAISCALSVAGCSGSDTATSQSPTATTTTTTTTSATRPECTAVADAARTLATDVGGLLSGQTSAEQVRTAFDNLTDSVADAKEVVGGDAKEQLDAASEALGKARDVLENQPLQLAALRTTMSDALSALGEATRVCAPDADPVPGSVTGSATATS